MQMSEAAELRKQWGDKPCDHDHVVKEYARGTSTGDYVCTTCGSVGYGRDWPKKEREQN